MLHEIASYYTLCIKYCEMFTVVCISWLLNRWVMGHVYWVMGRFLCGSVGHSLWPIACSAQIYTSNQGRISWGSGGAVLTPPPWKYAGGVRVCFDRHVTFFHSEQLLDNSASFTSWRLKDLRQKRKVKLIFPDPWNSLMAWPDWLWSPPPYFITHLRHCIQSTMSNHGRIARADAGVTHPMLLPFSSLCPTHRLRIRGFCI